MNTFCVYNKNWDNQSKIALPQDCKQKKGFAGKIEKKVNKKLKEQSKMNKQPTTIRTYLLRGAFLLSLAFVIVMPLALGQTRSQGSKPSVAAAQMPQVAPPSTGAISSGPAIPALPALQLPTSGPTGVRSPRILPQPQFPSVILYDQYDNDLNN